MNVVYYSVDPSALHASLPASLDSQFRVQTKINFHTFFPPTFANFQGYLRTHSILSHYNMF
jgi:hypothetical protein